jgi:hypothetical protein
MLGEGISAFGRRAAVIGSDGRIASGLAVTNTVPHALHLTFWPIKRSSTRYLRAHCGLTKEETAEALDVSLSTIKREWRYIKRWLYTQLSRGDSRYENPPE